MLKGIYPKLRKEGYDLHELHALMAPRPFLVSGGYSDGTDRWTALNHTIAVNRLLGYRNNVAMSNRVNHDPTPESNEIIYDFFLNGTCIQQINLPKSRKMRFLNTLFRFFAQKIDSGCLTLFYQFIQVT